MITSWTSSSLPRIQVITSRGIKMENQLTSSCRIFTAPVTAIPLPSRAVVSPFTTASARSQIIKQLRKRKEAYSGGVRPPPPEVSLHSSVTEQIRKKKFSQNQKSNLRNSSASWRTPLQARGCVQTDFPKPGHILYTFNFNLSPYCYFLLYDSTLKSLI